MNVIAFLPVTSSYNLQRELQLRTHLLEHHLLRSSMLITMTCYMTKIGSLNIEGRESCRLKQVNCDTERSVTTQCDRGCGNADRIFRLKGINCFGGLYPQLIIYCYTVAMQMDLAPPVKKNTSIRVPVFLLGL